MSDMDVESTGAEKAIEKVEVVKARVWPGVMGGMILASMVIGWGDDQISGDVDPNTYKPKDLTVVVFSPEPGVFCKGLSPEGQSQVIASTIICDYQP